VKDTSTETGHIYVAATRKCASKSPSRSAHDPAHRRLPFLFNPKINRVEEFDLGKNRSLVDQYVLLGFVRRATTSEELTCVRRWRRELDHKKTVVLELTPKSIRFANQIIKIQMWIDEASWLPVQQKFFVKPARATTSCSITSMQ